MDLLTGGGFLYRLCERQLPRSLLSSLRDAQTCRFWHYRGWNEGNWEVIEIFWTLWRLKWILQSWWNDEIPLINWRRTLNYLDAAKLHISSHYSKAGLDIRANNHQVFMVLYDCKLIIFGFLTVNLTEGSFKRSHWVLGNCDVLVCGSVLITDFWIKKS